MAGKVLLVEDDVLVRDVMEGGLEDGGYDVATAPSGAEALLILQARDEEFCALVTDVNLGEEVDGWVVGRLAREVAPAIAVVYASGDSEHVWRIRGVPRSVMLPKPFDTAQLIRAVREACAMSER